MKITALETLRTEEFSNVLWVRVRDAITSTLDSMTLADLVPPRVFGVDDPKGVLITS